MLEVFYFFLLFRMAGKCRCATLADCRLADYISCYLYEYMLYIPIPLSIPIPIPIYLYLYEALVWLTEVLVWLTQARVCKCRTPGKCLVIKLKCFVGYRSRFYWQTTVSLVASCLLLLFVGWKNVPQQVPKHVLTARM